MVTSKQNQKIDYKVTEYLMKNLDSFLTAVNINSLLLSHLPHLFGYMGVFLGLGEWRVEKAPQHLDLNS